MHGILSNGLSLLAEAQVEADAAAAPIEFTRLMWAILITGGALAIYWGIQTVRSPQRFLLKDAPPRPNDVHPVLPMGVFLMAALAAKLSAGPLHERFQDARADILTALVLNVSMMIISLIIMAKLFVGGLRGAGLSLRFWPVDTARVIAGWLISLPMCFGLLLLTVYLIHSLAPDRAEDWIRKHGLLQAMSEVSPPWRIAVYLSAAALGPIAEELLFRGLVQSSIRQFTQRPWTAITFTSLLFVMAHHQNWHTWPALIPLSVAMGYSYERTGRLLPAIIIHILFNVTNLWIT